MAQRYDDLDDESQASIARLVDNTELPEGSRVQNSEFGICARCKYLAITRTEFQVVRACCLGIRNNLMPLTSAHPITECNQFEDANIPELWEMRQIAYYINEPATRAGFLADVD